MSVPKDLSLGILGFLERSLPGGVIAWLSRILGALVGKEDGCMDFHSMHVF